MSPSRFLSDDENKEATQKQVVKQYELWAPHLIQTKLEEWKNKYPNLVNITTSQEAYGLPRAGGKSDCPFANDGDGCPNYILTIQDFISHPEGSNSSNRLPEVFLSGCLHGNERVGPTTVMETAALLLEAAECESKPNNSQKNHVGHSLNGGNQGVDSRHEELEEAKSCRKELEQRGIDALHRRWLARLVSTRRIVIVPTANALGYFRNERTEYNIDPNRDFPYDLNDPNQCMQTIAGRTLNEIYRDHLFQLAFTFHGGMEVIGYEWGAPTWLNHFSPDDEAQSEIAAAYSRFGGGWSKSRPYKYGTMNDLVYYVRGGMEDWAYAGSWDSDRVVQCTPNTFNGYSKEKTKYNNSTLRVFNMLVETSNNKVPRKDELGTSLDLMNRDTSGNGHISRNIRLSLMAIDLVQPYVSIVAVNDLSLSDDIVPQTERGGTTCQTTKSVMVPKNAHEVHIEWTVGGSLQIDETQIWYGKWDDLTEPFDCNSQLTQIDINNMQLIQGEIIGQFNGTGFGSRPGPHPAPTSSRTGTKPALGPVFRGTIDISNGLYHTHDKIFVIAGAKVDQNWVNQPTNMKPNLPPQSHIVNARTDPTWHHESAGKEIFGQLYWYSIPLTIFVGDYDNSIGIQNERQVDTVELHNRFGESTGTMQGGMRPAATPESSPKATPNSAPVTGWEIFGLLVLVWACTMSLFLVVRQRKQKKERHQNRSSGDGFVFDSKPYSDNADTATAESFNEDDDDEQYEGGEVEIPPIS